MGYGIVLGFFFAFSAMRNTKVFFFYLKQAQWMHWRHQELRQIRNLYIRTFICILRFKILYTLLIYSQFTIRNLRTQNIECVTYLMWMWWFLFLPFVFIILQLQWKKLLQAIHRICLAVADVDWLLLFLAGLIVFLWLRLMNIACTWYPRSSFIFENCLNEAKSSNEWTSYSFIFISFFLLNNPAFGPCPYPWPGARWSSKNNNSNNSVNVIIRSSDFRFIKFKLHLHYVHDTGDTAYRM